MLWRPEERGLRHMRVPYCTAEQMTLPYDDIPKPSRVCILSHFTPFLRHTGQRRVRYWHHRRSGDRPASFAHDRKHTNLDKPVGLT